MDVAAAGQLIIFFSLTVGQILIGVLVLAYSGYSFLHVLISTAAGNDDTPLARRPTLRLAVQGMVFVLDRSSWRLAGILIVSLAGIVLTDPVQGIALARFGLPAFPFVCSRRSVVVRASSFCAARFLPAWAGAWDLC